MMNGKTKTLEEGGQNMKLYVVLVAMNALDVNGVETKLPKGHWFLPVFEDQEEAFKFANGRRVMLAEQEEKDAGR